MEAQRGALASRGLLEKARAEGEGNPLFERGLFAHPAEGLSAGPDDRDYVLQVSQDGNWQDVHSADQLDFRGDIFIDGSFFPHVLKGLGRAGWGAVKVDELGFPIARAYGPVWLPLPQSAPSAEWAAYVVACQLCRGPTEVHMDCLSVINVLRKGQHLQLHHKHTHAGYARSALGEDGAKLINGIHKVKAHQDILGGGLEGRELARARANDAADVAAKLGARCHGCPDVDLLAEVQQLVVLSKEIFVLAARLLPLWRPCGHQARA